MSSPLTPPTMEELEQRARESDVPGVAFVTNDEFAAMFDDAVRKYMHMSGEEFISRWNAGEWSDVWDTSEYWHVGYLAGMIPFVGQQNT